MTKAKLTVAQDLVVSLEYVLRLEDGEIVDRSGQEPLKFLQGFGNIIPGLEDSLYGMAVGDAKEVVVTPANGYGEHDPENFQKVSRDVFPPDMALTEGLGLHLRDSQTGQVYEAYVVETRDDQVLLDFNHPLAGETLYFQVKVTDLREASAEELAHGHVHTPGQSH